MDVLVHPSGDVEMMLGPSSISYQKRECPEVPALVERLNCSRDSGADSTAGFKGVGPVGGRSVGAVHGGGGGADGSGVPGIIEFPDGTESSKWLGGGFGSSILGR